MRLQPAMLEALDQDTELSRVRREVEDAVCHLGPRLKVLGWMLMSAAEAESSPRSRHAMETAIAIVAETLDTYAERLESLERSVSARSGSAGR